MKVTKMSNDPSTDLKNAVNIAKKLIFENPEVEEALHDLKSITFKTVLSAFPAIWFILKTIVVAIEIVQKHYNLCTEEERIEVAAEIADELFVFKGWLSLFEPFDNLMFKLLLSAAVNALNEKVGKDWFGAVVNKSDNSTVNVSEVFKIV